MPDRRTFIQAGLAVGALAMLGPAARAAPFKARAAVVDAAKAKRALSALRAALGKQWVFDATQAELGDYSDAYGLEDAAARRPLAAVLPANLKQLQQVLAIAGRYQLPLWPLSTAQNLGYGGAAPAQAGVVMLSLKRMARILEVNEQQAYAVVEPGVSYLDLHRHLRATGSGLWLDPTASPHGGPLGNFLERGVGYTPYGQHCESQCGLAALLADGTVVETAPEASKVEHAYRYGHRAWVDGLFNQSNFGIVTRIGVQLMPAPAGYRPYLVTVAAEDDLHALIEALRPLCLEGVMAPRATLMSLVRAASFSTTRAACQDAAGPLGATAQRKLMARLGLGSWNLYGALYGAEPLMDEQWRIIADALRAVPGVALHFAATRDADAAFTSRAALLGGTPSMDEYQTLNWVGNGAHLDFSAVLPFDPATALASYRAARDLCHARGFDYGGEFQLEGRSLRHEVRVIFARGVGAQQRAAHALHQALSAQSVGAGHASPRAHLAFMDDTAASYAWNDNALLRAGEAIKDVLDPQGLLAPGKAGLWPGRYARRKKT